jgi:signal transduction histidine kinase
MERFDKILPPELLQDPKTARTARYVCLGGWLASALTIPLVIARLVEGSIAITLITGLSAIAFGLLPLLVIATRNVTIGAWGVPGIAVVVLTAMGFVEHGLHADSLFWFAFVPFLGAIFLGRRGAVGFTLASVAAITALYLTHVADGSVDTRLTLRFFAAVNTPVFAGALGWFYDVAHEGERRDLDRARDGFVSTVSHELRTPLTAIRGALGLIRAGVVTGGEATEMLETADRNAERLNRLVDDLLDLSRMQAGQLSLKREKSSVSALVGEAVQEIQTMASAAGATVDVTQSDVDSCVDVDPVRFGQIMANLLSNAVKHGGDGARVEVVVQAASGAVQIGVRDDGPGIPLAFRDSVFERFSMANDSTTRGSGSGLGLAISKHLVVAFGGRIWFETEDGKGTTFWIELPTVTG